MTETDAVELIRGERFVVLMRHGIAEERSDSRPDRDRSLTREGQTRVKQISKALVRLLPTIDRLYSSSFVRCVQTAMYLAKSYDDKARVETLSELSADAPSSGIVDLIRNSKAQRMIVVGHEPNLSEACAALIGATGVPMELRRGGFYGLRIGPDGARLEWMIAPRVIRRLTD